MKFRNKFTSRPAVENYHTLISVFPKPGLAYVRRVRKCIGWSGNYKAPLMILELKVAKAEDIEYQY